MGTFAGKIAIVTGGASGIGRALSEELARRGAAVVLADFNARLLNETVEAITGAGYKALGARLDVCDFVAVAKLVADTAAEHGRLDLLFNNAGVTTLGEAHLLDMDDWRKVVSVDLYGVINGVAAAYPLMVRQGFGQIVNTSSLAGLIPAPHEVPYSTVKHGIVGLSVALRIEAGARGVKVNVVCPGYVRTPGYDSMEVKGLDRRKILDMLPRMMSPEECASVILRGVEKDKAVILVTGGAKALWALQRVSPSLVRALMGWMSRVISRKAGLPA